MKENLIRSRQKIFKGTLKVTVKVAVVLTALVAIAVALAHATIVIVTLTLDPLTPKVNEPLNFSLYLETPLQVPVEDAIIILEAKPKDGVTTEVTKVTLNEDPEKPGSYLGEITPNKDGPWDFFFRDQTYKAEEANQHIEVRVGEENFADIEFIFPPTAIQSSNSWRTWLVWLVGLPLVAAIILTVFVLTSSSKDEKNMNT